MTDFGSRHKISHQDGGGDEIDVTGLVGRVNYVDRGDPSAMDWLKQDLTMDSTFRDLDCSAIVPAGAKAIHIQTIISATTTGLQGILRKNGNANYQNVLAQYTQIANTNIAFEGVVSCDANRIIEYYFPTATWVYIGILIKGWFI